MKRKLKIISVFVLLLCLTTGWASADTISDFIGYIFRAGMLNSITETEDELYIRAVDEFFAALDAKDAKAIRSMFAPAVAEAQPDMDAQIIKLFAVYPGITELKMCSGAGESGATLEDGRSKCYIKNRFPVKSDGNEFVCQLHLVYEDDWDENQIGLQQVVLMNLDMAYKFSHDDPTRSLYPTEIGLHVLTDYDSGMELRFINNHVEKLQSMDRCITEAEIREFCADEANHSYSALLEAFGEPNGVEDNSSYLVILYELQEMEGEKRYFKAFVDAESRYLDSASIVGEFEWISQVIDSEPEA